MARLAIIGFCGVILLMTTGCSSLLPSAKSTTKAPWKSFTEAKAAFDKIDTGNTGSAGLKELGFDIIASPNVKILNYLDIAATVQSIRLEDLDPGLQKCLRARIDCRGYVFEPKVNSSKRIGNFWLDILNFKRRFHDTGWSFKALLILVNDRVCYKLWSGTPINDEYREQRNPLGPLQDAGGMLLNLR